MADHPRACGGQDDSLEHACNLLIGAVDTVIKIAVQKKNAGTISQRKDMTLRQAHSPRRVCVPSASVRINGSFLAFSLPRSAKNLPPVRISCPFGVKLRQNGGLENKSGERTAFVCEIGSRKENHPQKKRYT